MKRVLQVVSIGLIAVAAAAVAINWGASTSELAKKDAQTIFADLRNNPYSGDVAATKVSQIQYVLSKVHRKLSDIGTTDAELTNYIRRGYHRDGIAALEQLRQTHGKPEEAKGMKVNVEDFAAKAGETVTAFHTTDADLKRLVAMNAVEFAQRTGARLSPADYKAAGVALPTVTKTRTVIRRVPAKPVTRVAVRKPVHQSVRRRTAPR